MGKEITNIRIAENQIRCSFRYKDTASFFHDWIYDTDDDSEIVEIDTYDEELWKKTGSSLDPHAEYSLLCGGVSDHLMKNNAFLIHAVAFRYKDRAFLICGAPGRGKSTQIQYLMNLYPGEFSVICGDRPCLKIHEDGKIFVYPTPWNGKEGWHGGEACELKGVFYLYRSEETSIRQFSHKEAVFPVFSSIISRRDDAQTIKRIGYYSEQIIKKYPVYKYVNGGVPDSTRAFYDKILNEVDGNEI